MLTKQKVYPDAQKRGKSPRATEQVVAEPLLLAPPPEEAWAGEGAEREPLILPWPSSKGSFRSPSHVPSSGGFASFTGFCKQCRSQKALWRCKWSPKEKTLQLLLPDGFLI